ncbi:hypothetical protein [Prosthecobacter sp.]|uniref:hypothetical protein n=1 Tax=Prosthecobacter sp. TaxID=1965333 RepID=UPI003782E636
MSPRIEINRSAVEGGIRTLLGRRSRRAWQVVILLVILSVPGVYAWRANGDGAKLTVGDQSYPQAAVLSAKVFALLAVTTMIAVPLIIIQRSHERKMILDMGAAWEKRSGGKSVVEILGDQIRHQAQGEEKLISPLEVRDLLEGKRYAVLVCADATSQESFFFAVDRKEEEFVEALKKMSPQISRSFS